MINIDKLILDKYNVRRRLVDVSDAEFITNLRSNMKLAKHIHFADGDINKQIEWIQHYKYREKQGLEEYYIYESLEGEKYGTTRNSDYDDHSFVIGSWLFSPNAPQGLALLSECAGKKAGFDDEKFIYTRFDVRKLNKKVVNYHTKIWHSLKITEDDINNYYILTRENFERYFDSVVSICNIV